MAATPSTSAASPPPWELRKDGAADPQVQARETFPTLLDAHRLIEPLRPGIEALLLRAILETLLLVAILEALLLGAILKALLLRAILDTLLLRAILNTVLGAVLPRGWRGRGPGRRGVAVVRRPVLSRLVAVGPRVVLVLIDVGGRKRRDRERRDRGRSQQEALHLGSPICVRRRQSLSLWPAC